MNNLPFILLSLTFRIDVAEPWNRGAYTMRAVKHNENGRSLRGSVFRAFAKRRFLCVSWATRFGSRPSTIASASKR